MTTITLNYDTENAVVKSILDAAILAGAKIVEKEESPYNKEFVAKIRKSEKQEGVKINVDELWK